MCITTFTFPGMRVLCVLLCVVCQECSGHLMLEPLEGKPEVPGGRVVRLVVIPEVGVAHTDYVVFGRLVQELYPLQLWVALADVSHEPTISMDNLPLLIMESQNELHYAGMSTDVHVVLAAHGDTAAIVSDYAKADPSTLRGVVLLGAVLPRGGGGGEAVLDFPLPVLSIVGELDGVTRLTRLAQTVQDMLDSPQFTRSSINRAPLVVLEGSNHGVFTTAPLPQYLKHLDIQEERDQGVAMESAAHKLAAFITHVTQEPQYFSQTAEVEFQHAWDHAVNLTRPIRELRHLTQRDRTSYWVKSAQKWLSGQLGPPSGQFEVNSFVSPIGIMPAIIKLHGIVHIEVSSDVVKRDSDPHGPLAPDEIAARMLGPSTIQARLQAQPNTSYTCADLNYAAYQTAYHTATEAARRRYNGYHRGMTFEPDVVTYDLDVWEASTLQTWVQDGVMHVTSTALMTPDDPSRGQDAGLYFCKLLPPDRALEWMMVDALRRGTGA